MLAAATAISGFVLSLLAGLGPIAAPVIGAATIAGPVATAGTALAGLAGTGSAAGGSAALGGGAAAVGANPHAQVGIQNGINDTLNTAKENFAGSVNGLNIPGAPQITFN